MSPVTLTTLTPVHIGDGEYHTNWSYLVDGDRFHAIPPEAFSLLSEAELKDLLDSMGNRLESLTSFVARRRTIADKLKKAGVYTLPLQEQAKGKVFTFIKTSGRVYIPGSGVKGALRTALLYSLLHEGPLASQLGQTIASSGPDKRGKVIQALAYRPAQRDDAKYDLLKLLSVGDSDTKIASEVLIVAPVVTVGLRRGILSQSHELLKRGVEFNLSIQVASGRSKDELFRHFNFQPVQQRHLQDVPSVFRAAYLFYDKVLSEDISYFKSHGQSREYRSAVEKLEELKGLNKQESPLIRLGKHQGFVSLTMALLLKELTPEFYTRNVARSRAGARSFPKTRKLAQIGGTSLPLGWVQLKQR